MISYLKTTLTVLITFFISTTAFAESHTIEMLNKSGNEMMVYSKKIVKVNVGDTVSWKATTKGHNVEFIRNGTPEGVGKFKSKMNVDVGVMKPFASGYKASENPISEDVKARSVFR